MLIFLAGGFLLAWTFAFAKSAYSPRHSGLEMPGDSRPSQVLPGGRSPSRTAEGGMGYTDAYGNTIKPNNVDENNTRKKSAQRSRFKEKSEKLPYADQSPPLWTFK